MEQKGNMSGWSGARKSKCLCCDRAFLSPGPFLRICPACKESEEWQSGNCDFVLNAANDNDPAER